MRDIFFFTDIHGNKMLFDAIMKYCNEQDEDATIIFGGDAIDRGINGYYIMKKLLNNPRVIYLKGNHEDMFVQAALAIKTDFNFDNKNIEYFRKALNICATLDDIKYEAIRASLKNGGMPTLMDWILDGMPTDILEKINELPYIARYENIDFSHASVMPQVFQRAYDADYEGKPIDEYDAFALLWSRTPLNYGWIPNRINVFGHTPVQLLSEFVKIKPNIFEPIKFNPTTAPAFTGARLDMDAGTAFSNKAFVLNALTMKAQGFELKNGAVEKINVIQF